LIFCVCFAIRQNYLSQYIDFGMLMAVLGFYSNSVRRVRNHGYGSNRPDSDLWFQLWHWLMSTTDYHVTMHRTKYVNACNF